VAAISAAIREIVRERADRRCEYCRKPDGISVYPHHIEHIISRKHGGLSDLENLAWACFQCNVSKGTDVASYDSVTGELVPLYNPRLDTWDEHFQLVNDEIVGRTPIGRITVWLLQVNHPEQVETRRLLIAAGLW
jgi:hypothetical protein